MATNTVNEAVETPVVEAEATEKAPEQENARGNRRFSRDNNRRPSRRNDRAPQEKEFEERVVKINRITKVVKGGRRMRFAALVVVGDKKGRIGFGTGKAKEVPDAIRKATENAQHNLFRVSMVGSTIPHEIVGRYGLSKVRCIVEGGENRYDSVYNGLLACSDPDFVMIHDGARPFVSKQLIEDCIRRASIQYAAIPVVKSTDTLRAVDENGSLIGTYDRDRVVRVQTPQIFRYESIRGAYEEMREDPAENVTDDAMVMELYGDLPVRMYEASYSNIKITTPEDLLLAGEILREIRKTK